MFNTKKNFQEYIDEFLEVLELEGKSDHTLRAYRHDLNGLREELAGKTLNTIQPADIRKYLLELEEGGKTEITINRLIACYKAFFKFLTQNGYLKTNPMQWVKSVKLQEGREPEYLTVDEMMRLLDAPHLDKPYGLRDYTILMLFYNTGIRIEEFCKLNTADLKLPKRGEGQLKVVGKGNKVRWIPLNLTMKKVLKKYLETKKDKKDPLFLNRYGERFSPNGVRKLVYKYLAKVGIEKRGVHLLRHTFGTHSYNTNPNLIALQKILGHKSPKTTEIYTHLSLDDLRKQTKDLPANRFR